MSSQDEQEEEIDSGVGSMELRTYPSGGYGQNGTYVRVPRGTRTRTPTPGPETQMLQFAVGAHDESQTNHVGRDPILARFIRNMISPPPPRTDIAPLEETQMTDDYAFETNDFSFPELPKRVEKSTPAPQPIVLEPFVDTSPYRPQQYESPPPSSVIREIYNLDKPLSYTQHLPLYRTPTEPVVEDGIRFDSLEDGTKGKALMSENTPHAPQPNAHQPLSVQTAVDQPSAVAPPIPTPLFRSSPLPGSSQVVGEILVSSTPSQPIHPVSHSPAPKEGPSNAMEIDLDTNLVPDSQPPSPDRDNSWMYPKPTPVQHQPESSVRPSSPVFSLLLPVKLGMPASKPILSSPGQERPYVRVPDPLSSSNFSRKTKRDDPPLSPRKRAKVSHETNVTPERQASSTDKGKGKANVVERMQKRQKGVELVPTPLLSTTKPPQARPKRLVRETSQTSESVKTVRKPQARKATKANGSVPPPQAAQQHESVSEVTSLGSLQQASQTSERVFAVVPNTTPPAFYCGTIVSAKAKGKGKISFTVKFDGIDHDSLDVEGLEALRKCEVHVGDTVLLLKSKTSAKIVDVDKWEDSGKLKVLISKKRSEEVVEVSSADIAVDVVQVTQQAEWDNRRVTFEELGLDMEESATPTPQQPVEFFGILEMSQESESSVPIRQEPTPSTTPSRPKSPVKPVRPLTRKKTDPPPKVSPKVPPRRVRADSGTDRLPPQPKALPKRSRRDSIPSEPSPPLLPQRSSRHPGRKLIAPQERYPEMKLPLFGNAFILALKVKNSTPGQRDALKKELRQKIEALGGHFFEDWHIFLATQGKITGTIKGQRTKRDVTGTTWMWTAEGEMGNGALGWRVKPDGMGYAEKKYDMPVYPQRVWVLADEPNGNLKYWCALAMGVPCVHVRWLLDRETRFPWTSYLLPAGHSDILGLDCPQQVDHGWGQKTRSVYDIIDKPSSITRKAFKDKSVLFIYSQHQGLVNVEGFDQRYPVTMMVCLMGASRVELVHDVKHTKTPIPEFDFVISDLPNGPDPKDRKYIMNEGKGRSFVFATHKWVKECLMAGFILPLKPMPLPAVLQPKSKRVKKEPVDDDEEEADDDEETADEESSASEEEEPEEVKRESVRNKRVVRS